MTQPDVILIPSPPSFLPPAEGLTQSHVESRPGESFDDAYRRWRRIEFRKAASQSVPEADKIAKASALVAAVVDHLPSLAEILDGETSSDPEALRRVRPALVRVVAALSELKEVIHLDPRRERSAESSRSSGNLNRLVSAAFYRLGKFDAPTEALLGTVLISGLRGTPPQFRGSGRTRQSSGEEDAPAPRKELFSAGSQAKWPPAALDLYRTGLTLGYEEEAEVVAALHAGLSEVLFEGKIDEGFPPSDVFHRFFTHFAAELNQLADEARPLRQLARLSLEQLEIHGREGPKVDPTVLSPEKLAMSRFVIENYEEVLREQERQREGADESGETLRPYWDRPSGRRSGGTKERSQAESDVALLARAAPIDREILFSSALARLKVTSDHVALVCERAFHEFRATRERLGLRSDADLVVSVTVPFDYEDRFLATLCLPPRYCSPGEGGLPSGERLTLSGIRKSKRLVEELNDRLQDKSLADKARPFQIASNRLVSGLFSKEESLAIVGANPSFAIFSTRIRSEGYGTWKMQRVIKELEDGIEFDSAYWLEKGAGGVDLRRITANTLTCLESLSFLAYVWEEIQAITSGLLSVATYLDKMGKLPDELDPVRYPHLYGGVHFDETAERLDAALAALSKAEQKKFAAHVRAASAALDRVSPLLGEEVPS